MRRLTTSAYGRSVIIIGMNPSDEEIQRYIEDRLDAIVLAVSASCLAIISEALKEVRDQKLTYAEAMARYPEDMARFEELLADGRATAAAGVRQVFNEMAAMNDDFMKKYYEAAGVVQEGAATNETMRGILASKIQEAEAVIAKTINSSVVGVVDSTGRFIGFGDYYRKSLTEAVTGMLAGEASYQEATRKVVEQMARSGLRTATTATGETVQVIGQKVGIVTQNGEYITRELYGKIRQEVMQNYKQALYDLRRRQGMEFGADGVEIDAHSMCAPDHVHYQGKQYTYEEFEEFDSAPGFRSFETLNCRHVVTPIILGISSPAYTDKELEHLKELGDKEKTIDGLSGEPMTKSGYEWTQYQRQLERMIRQEENLAYQLEKAGQDASAVRARIEWLRSEYRRISRAAALPLQNDRTKAYIAR